MELEPCTITKFNTDNGFLRKCERSTNLEILTAVLAGSHCFQLFSRRSYSHDMESLPVINGGGKLYRKQYLRILISVN